MEEMRIKYAIDLDDEIVLRRLNRLRREKVRDLFEEGKYNYEVFDLI